VGRKDPKLIVVAAVCAQAMPNYVAKKKDSDTDEVTEEGDSPTTFEENKVAIVRAARIDEKTLLGDLGVEQLTAKGGIGAIIHDKIVVIDPLSPDCTQAHLSPGHQQRGDRAARDPSSGGRRAPKHQERSSTVISTGDLRVSRRARQEGDATRTRTLLSRASRQFLPGTQDRDIFSTKAKPPVTARANLFKSREGGDYRCP